MMVDALLEYIKKTNPEMTREKLLEELKKNSYATKGLIFTFNNYNCLK